MVIDEEVKKTVEKISASAEIQSMVNSIETKPETTRGHYGDYMTLLAGFDSTNKRLIIALALIKAGASRDGVTDALRLLGAL